MRSKLEIKKFAKQIINVDKTLFDIKFEDNEDKIIFGNHTPDSNDHTGKWFKLRSLHLVVYDLLCKISLSYGAILSFDFDSLKKNFDVSTYTSKEELCIFYYLENIVYRQITLWDLLAQFYNVHYDINLEINAINYKLFFSNYKQRNFLNVNKINKYIKYEYDNNQPKKQHQYISEYRNSLTHRLSNAVPSMSNLGIHMKECPFYLMEVLILDLEQYLFFYDELIKIILSSENISKLMNAFMPKGNILIIKTDKT